MRLTPLVSAALIVPAALILLAPGRALAQVLEQDPISFGHSEVGTIELAFSKRDILQFGLGEQHSRHSTIPELDS